MSIEVEEKTDFDDFWPSPVHYSPADSVVTFL